MKLYSKEYLFMKALASLIIDCLRSAGFFSVKEKTT